MRAFILATVATLLVASAHGTLDIIEDTVHKVWCDLPGKACPPPSSQACPPPTSQPPSSSTPAPATSIPPTPPGQGDNLLLTQTQIVGTFQSYHQAPVPAVFNLLNSPAYQANFIAQSVNIPNQYAFSHPTITQQLENGIRGFEFDTLADPKGGAYAYSAALKLTGASNTLISPDMLKPGIKSISLPDWNYGSSCYLFTECLQEIATWSSSNPKHFPIVVFIHHGGTTTPQSYLGSEYSAALAQLQANTTVLPNNFATGVNAAITDIKSEILSVFSLSQIYTPDNLRVDNKANATASLRDIVLPGAALNGSWPTIGALRGKILFFADPDYTSELEADFPGAVNSLLWPSDDNGDLDPNVVVLDGMVDVDFGNYSTTPYSFDTNADAQVRGAAYEVQALVLQGFFWEMGTDSALIEVQAAAYGIQAMVLQGFFIRGGVDSTLIEAQFNYTNRANSFQHIGGAQGLWTFLDVPSVQAYLPSTYQVNPTTQFGIGAVAACNPVLTSLDGSATGTTVTMGSVAYPFDGAINQLGGATIVEPPLPTCPNPEGFSM